jgi:hypothetical protein
MVGEEAAVKIGVKENRKDKDLGKRTVTGEVKNENNV